MYKFESDAAVSSQFLALHYTLAHSEKIL